MNLTGWRDALLSRTTCRLGWHNRHGITKYDGGRYPVLCPYCQTITGHWTPPQQGKDEP